MNKAELNYEDQFRSYLSDLYDNQRVISDCISRCKRVQKYEGYLTEHFKYDGGKSLLEKLHYTREEAKKEIKPKHSIEFRGSKGFMTIYEGTQSLNSAVNLYFDFLRKLKG